jgi:hypothetical protein
MAATHCEDIVDVAGGKFDEKAFTEVSTTGGSSAEGSEAGEGESRAQDADTEVSCITGEEALKFYVARFGDDIVLSDEGEVQRSFSRTSTHTGLNPAAMKPVTETGYDVPKDLYPYMGLASGDQGKAPFAPAPRVAKTGGTTPFRYIAGLDKDGSFALFDIRDEICLQVGGFKHGQVVRDRSGGELIVVGVKLADGAPHLWFQPRDLGRAGSGFFPGASREQLRARFSPIAPSAHVVQNVNVRQLRQVCVDDWCAAEDDDGEELVLCRQCHLPLGDFACTGEAKEEALLHGECLAQLLLKNLREDQAAKREEEQAVKAAKRAEYGIGWTVPEKSDDAHKESNLCCLVFDEETRTVRIAPTLEPAAAVNLEYLSQALEVRLKEGREPLFSLDMADPFDPACMQRKRFEPAWLAGTPAGDVLFQADYHLKELSMGEYEQPVTGMKSALDFYEDEKREDKWSAREWFMVREAAVHLSQDSVLVPYLKMSVEAREQIVGKSGCEDVKITRPDHPLVKYAEAFTEKFDLIAERKSVVHHLRELAKATVLAKFLADADIDIADCSWLHISEPEEGNQALKGLILEVPQLWNQRLHSKVTLQDGKIVDTGRGGDTVTHSVYGGVEFGLERFDLAEPRRGWQLPVRPAAAIMASRVPAPMAAPPSIKAAAMAARGMPGMKVTRRVPGVGAQGVDLNLDQFDLAEAERSAQLDGRVFEAAAGVQSSAFGEAFWKGIEEPNGNVFQVQDQQLLRSIFNPHLSDRKKKEGASVLPPDGGMAYVEELRTLVQQELAVQQQRKAHFLSSKFSEADAGPLFPAAWTDPVAFARTASPEEVLERHARSDYLAAAPAFAHVLRSATPTFYKSTEDGTHFRIYSFGSVEIRTTQAYDGQEQVGAVFSVRPVSKAGAQSRKDGSQVVKVTEYVEWERDQEKDAWHHSYVVVETTAGEKVVTEQLRDGSVTWEENPKDLEDRNSLAKVVRSANCSSASVLIRDVEKFQSKQARQSGGLPFVFHGQRKAYAAAIYHLASGEMQRPLCSGFRQRAKGTRNERLSMEGMGGWHGAQGQRNVKQTIRIALRK